MTTFRVRWMLRGAHMHCRVFVAYSPNGTFAKLGDLVMSERDFDAFRHSVGPRWQFLDDDEDDHDDDEHDHMTDDGLQFHAILRKADGSTATRETDNRAELLAWIVAHGDQGDELDGTAARLFAGVGVSTVFLGLDHNWTLNGPPVLWESLVFGTSLDGEIKRYTSRAAALAGHAELLQRVSDAWDREHGLERPAGEPGVPPRSEDGTGGR